MSYVIESGISLRNRRPEWVVVDVYEPDPGLDVKEARQVAYRRMLARAHSLRALYEPHGGRKLRVREVTR